MATKQDVFNHVETLVACFLYYDRKEDEDLPVGEIERMVRDGELTADDIVNRFGQLVRASLPPPTEGVKLDGATTCPVLKRLSDA